ncbi:hypothetical protein RN51_00732 [Microbacterium oxydans]|uniref:Uncharacterized protein n=1 Tax=Microbacterium oxydans TaxID=82380 RepID=A0A0F0KYV2_9MICO|nr:hypothetical protein [Microbacterium oxydans]KJL25285.1 hypothetical protein RN51_00732 [Microbacterium oxydans]
MPTPEKADRWRPSATHALAVCGVALGFLLGGFPGAFGVFIVVVGIAAVRRAGRQQASIPRLECTFLILGGGEVAIAAMRFRVGDGDPERMTEHLRGRGWSLLEPPLEGPLGAFGRVGVAFQGDRSLAVRDLHGRGAAPTLLADRVSALPPGWGRAAQESGYVLLLVDDGAEPGAAPALGTYAVLEGLGSAGERRRKFPGQG